MAKETEGKLSTLLTNGRCIDPESGLDDVRHVGVRDGRIVSITDPALPLPEAETTIDCTGLVVTAGFIDIHSHGAGHPRTARMQALDGCTFHGEFEFGVDDPEAWFAAREGGQLIHYSCSAGHIPCRVAALADSAKPQKPHAGQPHMLDGCQCMAAESHFHRAAASETARVVGRLEAALAAGAIGLGLGIAYTSAADHEEVYRLFQLGARAGAPLFVHSRGTFEARAPCVHPASTPAAIAISLAIPSHQDLTDVHELFADAAATGAAVHLCHINSSSGPLNIGLILEMVDALQARGVDVTAEAYPYTAGMTRLDSGVFTPGWEARLKIGPEDLEWLETGEHPPPPHPPPPAARSSAPWPPSPPPRHLRRRASDGGDLRRAPRRGRARAGALLPAARGGRVRGSPWADHRVGRHPLR